MGRARKKIIQLSAKLEAQVLIEQKLILENASLAVGRVGETGANVLFGQLGIVGEDFLMRHARGQPTQHIGDGDA